MNFTIPNSTITLASEVGNMAITVFVGALIAIFSALGIRFVFKKYYKETKHSARLVSMFFSPWLNGITRDTNNYCKIGAYYSENFKKMIPFEPTELKKPSNHRFYREVMNNPKKYNPLIKDWKNLKDITLKINEEYANLYEEIRVNINNKINLPYWCPEPESDEPLEGYICYTTFIKAIYDEVEYKLSNPKKRQLHGNGEIKLMTRNTQNSWYFKWGNDLPLAVSLEKEHMDKAQSLFSQFIEDEKYKEKIKALSNKQKETYDIALEKVTADIENIIESIDLDNEVEEKVQHIVNPF